jgi:hypothetical protein
MHYLLPYDLKLRRVGSSALAATDFAAEVARAGGASPAGGARLLSRGRDGGQGCCADALPISRARDAARRSSCPRESRRAAGLSPVAPGRAVLSSCQARRTFVPVRADGRMSLFTYHLIEALTGHAQPQRWAPEVLVSDLISHLHRSRAGKRAGAARRPADPGLPRLAGNFPVALLLGGDGLGKGQVAPDPLLPLPSTRISFKAKLRGDGAIAQGDGATAQGKKAVFIGGNKVVNTGRMVSIVRNSGFSRGESPAYPFRGLNLHLGRGFAFLDQARGRDIFSRGYRR